MTSKQIRKVKYKGTLNLTGFELPCYVLEDGMRVLSGRQMINVLKMSAENSSGKRLGQNLAQKSLEPFVSKETGSGQNYEKIICYDGEKKIHGYKADALIDICRVYSRAKRTIPLAPRQRIIANQCLMLLEIFAKIGLTALIDEATGYQVHRPNDELLTKLKKEILEELKKEFKNTFTQPPQPSNPPALGSFTYDPENNSLTYGEKNLNYVAKSKKDLNWFSFFQKQPKISISIGVKFRPEHQLLFSYSKIKQDENIKTYRGYFLAYPQQKAVFSFSSKQELIREK